MIPLLFKTAGGIGLFLLGMVLLTDGLKAYAGDALRTALVRFTGTPLKALLSGAAVTVVVQSSSATTVAVIGFVSAGLLSLPQAIGVVIGASLGTTGTGWIVALLGLKISVGFYALPMVGIGALLKLLGRGRWQSLGAAVAGFGLIFLGIGTLQEGMAGLQERFDLGQIQADGVLGHLVMVVVGIVLTLIMQSSSAVVATTLTALHTGSIQFEHAMTLVIGAAIGTTVTGALAAIGGNVPAKRTALAHVLFNAATGLVALALLPGFIHGLNWAQDSLGLDPGAASLAAFHTAFIAFGAALFLPWIGKFSRLIERILPEEEPLLTRYLDPTVFSVPPVAVEATRRAMCDTTVEIVKLLLDRGGPGGAPAQRGTAQVEKAVEDIRQFLSSIPPVGDNQPMSRLRIGEMHALDHLFRLTGQLRGTPAAALLASEHLESVSSQFRAGMELARRGLAGELQEGWLDDLRARSTAVQQERSRRRAQLLESTAAGGQQPEATLRLLDAIRWMDGSLYHTWRVANYLAGQGEAVADRD